MWCVKCNFHLSRCTCPDLQERLEKINKVVIISPENKDAYDKRARVNKELDKLNQALNEFPAEDKPQGN
jgi:uncharacterized protein YpbB